MSDETESHQSQSSDARSSAQASQSQYARPNYMTVGDGQTSEYADRLTAMLDNDSGYGSIADDASMKDWQAGLLSDRPLPPLHSRRESDRKQMASHRSQFLYNKNRTELGRAITKTLEQLQTLQEYNQQWPAQYPSIQPPTPASPISPRIGSRPQLPTTQSHRGELPDRSHRPHAPRRSETTIGERSASQGESSAASAQKPAPEPRLVSPQLARDFSVLKIDLKMDGLSQTDIIHSLKKDSRALAQLLDGQINKSKRHLSLLRERIEDTSSKVLVTGDLNAGKSTFCNALLRRKILPEDEQPCTSIFCEVLDVRDNGGIEEVHAIKNGITYNRNDERTYEVFPLAQLEDIVTKHDKYSQCKVYVKDIRTVDESLLNNGVLDIALIDAPGLNNDSLKTTAVFARQEEIDVVVFVVSAANHFTLSAKEFIYDAAREKAFMFMVVNGFDAIKNKERCQEGILKQVAHLSPATFKESSELVHFVSSNAIPVAAGSGSNPGGSSSGGASSSNGGPPGEPGGDDNEGSSEVAEGDDGDKGPVDKGKGRVEDEKLDRFTELEASLRRFVLEKRARSKLAPARTYLLNVLDDVHNLADFNQSVAQSELDRVSKELNEIQPALDSAKKTKGKASDDLDQSTEDTVQDVYKHTYDTLATTISSVSTRDLGVEYPGFWDAYRYADEIIGAMLQEISDSVGTCEDFARKKTVDGVNMIKSLGAIHLGDGFINLNFEPDRMLRRKKDTLARQVDIEVDIWDFFDVSQLWDQQEKFAGTGMAMTVAGVLGGRMIGIGSWLDPVLGAVKVVGINNLRRVALPGFILAGALTVAYAVASIPQSLPRRLSQKLSSQLTMLDFNHNNALRVSSEVRRALKIPADNLRVGLQRNLEQLQTRREETDKLKTDSEVARKYFGNLLRASDGIRNGVIGMDLDERHAME